MSNLTPPSPAQVRARLIFGCGYVGHRAAIQWRQMGHRVTVVTRSVERSRALADEGLKTIVADVTQPATLTDLPAAKLVLFAVGFDRRRPGSIGDVYAGGIKHVLDALPLDTGRVIYVSSTGVYGHSDGDWIDEDTPPRPTREGGRACLAAEQVLFAHSLGERGVVLRFAGIYGPGRVPRQEDVRAGKPITGNGDGILNLIHVDDAVEAILAAESRATPPRIYNVSDGNPAPRRAYYEELSRLLDAPPPRFSPLGEAGSQRARGADDKRVSNLRMVNELGVTLRYPSFREGLSAIM